jgi:REP element-mobilizing transposase RayT
MVKRPPQLALELLPTFGWGGRRPGSGRKPAGSEAGISHRHRDETTGRKPIHVTLRFARRAGNLRTVAAYGAVAASLRGLLDRADFRVVHFTVMASHVHLIVEADLPGSLGRAMRGLSMSLTKRLNKLRGTRGRVLSDRYHSHVLSTPTEVRNAVAYVLGNYASHARRSGELVPPGFVDPCSSAAPVDLDGLPPPVSPPRTWLLTTEAAERTRTISAASEEVFAYAA